MRTFFGRMRREFFCVNRTAVWIFGLLAVVFGALFAAGGVNRHVFGCFLLPRCALPPLLMVILWGLMLFLLGACAVFVYCSDASLRTETKNTLMLLFLASLVLCYAWIPLVYKAASFFSALLVLAVLLLCLAAIFLTIRKTHCAAVLMLCIFALWTLYILYYTFALLLIN